MAESSAGTPPRSGEAATVSLPTGRPARRTLQPATEESDIDMHDGPDFVDDWMEKNLTPDLIDFVRNHCTSFARWDVLRYLQTAPPGLTLEALSRVSGLPEATAASELKNLTAAGLVAQRNGRGVPTYYLGSGSGWDEAIEAAVEAYEKDREFRFALVYTIVRATSTGTVLE